MKKAAKTMTAVPVIARVLRFTLEVVVGLDLRLLMRTA